MNDLNDGGFFLLLQVPDRLMGREFGVSSRHTFDWQWGMKPMSFTLSSLVEVIMPGQIEEARLASGLQSGLISCRE